MIDNVMIDMFLSQENTLQKATV